MDAEQRLEDAKTFLNECSGKRVHIFHDSDADGIGSGMQLVHTLKRLGAKPTRSTHTERAEILGRPAYENAESLGAQRIIIADVNPKTYHTYEAFKEVFGDAPTLIIDHHRIEEYQEELFVHPQQVYDVEGSDYCTAKLTYDLCTAVTDADDLAWLAAAGIIGDMNDRFFEAIIRKALVQEGFDPDQDPHNSQINVINDAIQCCQAASNDALKSYLDDLESCETLAEACALGNPHPEVADAFDKIIAQVEKDIDDNPVNWIQLETPFGIAGWVSNAVSSNHPDSIFVIYRNKGDAYTMSLRNQSRRVHLGEVADKCASAVGGSGGGHKPAAGAKVPKERFEEYQRLVQEEIASRL